MNKIEAFCSIAQPSLAGLHRKNLVDCCAGDGRAGIALSKQHEKILFVDIRQTERFKRNIVNASFPFELFLDGIESFTIPDSAAIIAVHACGILTDEIIEKAVQSRSPLAVMPCCYNQRMKRYSLQNPPEKRKLLYPSEKDYYDAFRLQYLAEHGYRAMLRRIDPRITPMNNVIIGLPN